MKYSFLLTIAVIVVALILVVLVGLPTHEADNKVAANISKNSSVSLIVKQNQTGENRTTPHLPEGNYDAIIYTDNQTYAPRSRINITLNLTVPGPIPNAEIHIFGIKNRYGAYKIERDMVMDLVSGLNVITTLGDVPSCTSCSGISPGTFEIYGVLYYEGAQIVNATTSIEITA